MQKLLKYNVYKYGLWLMLLAMLWSSAGHIAWTGVRRVHYVLAGREEANEVLCIDVRDFEKDVVWVEHNEIRYRGKMFDIKARRLSGNKLLLSGHFDEDDDKLFQLLGKLFDGSENKHHREKRLPVWLCEAVVPEAFNPTIILCEAYSVPDVAYTQACIPLHKPAAPFQPPTS